MGGAAEGRNRAGQEARNPLSLPHLPTHTEAVITLTFRLVVLLLGCAVSVSIWPRTILAALGNIHITVVVLVLRAAPARARASHRRQRNHAPVTRADLLLPPLRPESRPLGAGEVHTASYTEEG